MNFGQSNAYDIAIVGSGIACTSFLLQFLEKLESRPYLKDPITVAVIEKDEEFWKGIPYGSRSSPNSLTITTLGEFVPPSEKRSFLNWLETTLEEWLTYLKENGGETAKLWIKNNFLLIEKKQWDDIYIPRYLFGDYINQRIIAAIEKSSLNNLTSISTIKAEAKNLTRLNNFYEITLEDRLGKNTLISAGKVVLAIGSPPVKSLPSPAGGTHTYAYINDTYSPALEQNLGCIESVLSAVKDQHRRNILILGSNASSLELLYLIDTNSDLKKLLNKIVVISYSGKLPYRITPHKNNGYEFEYLLSLKSIKKFTPVALMSAIEKDIGIADDKGVHIGNVYYPLNDLVVDLLNEMDEGEQKFFYDNYGQKFSKLIRRAGAEYKDAASNLEKAGKLEMVQGAFHKLELPAIAEKGVCVTYTLPGNGKEITYPLEFPLVINCGGFEELSNSSSSLIKAIISKKLCVANSNRGVEVNENFEAEKGLYIIGPLLGGIFNSKARLWHVENAKSIFYLGNLLADTVLKALRVQELC